MFFSFGDCDRFRLFEMIGKFIFLVSSFRLVGLLLNLWLFIVMVLKLIVFMNLIVLVFL